ncbi:ATP-binding protein [Nocardioides sp. Root151]|uniref:ATP-binding protein n=1 Tax=Nocardioides sp. Root151 TaxID=1736475 RepID=UPI0007038C39|nr:helix-turn-helix transcriptional regulator [Nocardioides sp. Root151]KQZ69704.1 hypothetical protein ASD66_08210 [Nocardioides sp. Root151]
MLVGRDAEILALDRLVGGARIQQSGVLVVTGEPGIGKSTLLRNLADKAESVRILKADGVESESGLAFAGLHQLLLPLLDLLPALPGPQATALEVALALREGTAGDRFAVGAATLGLLSRCAEEEPLLLLVDDAHFFDHPSAEALVFASRRLMADPIAVVVATRPTTGTPVFDSDLPRLELEGLPPESVARLLADSANAPVAPDTVARVHRATAGNPLAVVELAEEVDAIDRLAPTTPLTVPDRLLGEFGRRVLALPARTRTALLIASIAEADAAVVGRALTELGTSIGDLTAAEEVGLVALSSGGITFRHPLVRSSAYGAASPAERRSAHLAVAHSQPQSDPDRRAWHLSETVIGVDEHVGDLLAEVGSRAAGRGAHSVAATAYERAAALSGSVRATAQRLLLAGEAAWLAGQLARAETLLEHASEVAPGSELGAAVDGVRGNLEMRAGSLDLAGTLLRRASLALAVTDPDAAAMLAADQINACFLLGATAEGLAAATRLEALLDSVTSTYVGVRGRMTIGMARVLAGEPGIELIRSAVEELEQGTWWSDDLRRPGWMVLGSLFLRESSTGRDLVDHVVQELRDRCALGTLPTLLFHVARDHATTDRWSSALAVYHEAVALARESGQTTDLAMSLAGRAWLSARMGQADDCRRDADEASTLADGHGIALARAWALSALGDLALGAGRAHEALGHFEALESLLSRIGLLDVDLSPGPERAEALVRLGRAAEAGEIAAVYRSRALAKGQPWAIARAERTLALLAGGGASVHFDAALSLHDGSPDLFERARTQLAVGSWHRRSRRRVAARPVLREALATFEELGAGPWAEQAAAELEATGEQPHRRGDRSIDLLTPQELQIAGLLGAGRTTREAAAALFLSPKTVEYHLRHVYMKLGIHTRAELRSHIDLS